MSTPFLFDADLEPAGLSDPDLANLRHFGVRAALCSAEGSPRARDASEFVGRGEALLAELPRLLAAGIAAFAQLGGAPDALPARGLEQALHRLAPLFSHPRAVAIGPLGLGSGSPMEEHALLRQCELAAELNRPVVVRLSERTTQPELRRLLALLHTTELDPRRVLLVGPRRPALPVLAGVHHFAALRIAPGRLTARAAAELVGERGSEGLLFGSGAGRGGTDLLSVPKAAAALVEAKVPASVVRRVLCDNALAFLRIDRDAL